MATRKQRRRREKEKRHDYELVEIDEEGNETVLNATELRPSDGGSKKQASAKVDRPRGRGVVQPPSWPRVLKRGALFAPIFLATVMLLGGSKLSFTAAVMQTAMLVAVFVPFSYFMDRVMWRSYQKRAAKARGA